MSCLFFYYCNTPKVDFISQSESAKRAETVRTLGERRRELEIELRGKDKLMTQLRTEAERSGKEAHRAAYTRRILEIIGNVEKQQVGKSN